MPGSHDALVKGRAGTVEEEIGWKMMPGGDGLLVLWSTIGPRSVSVAAESS